MSAMPAKSSEEKTANIAPLDPAATENYSLLAAEGYVQARGQAGTSVTPERP